MAAWCRGGAGVALATIRVGRLQLAAVQDLVEAVAGMLARAEVAALCLCHGALGVLELLKAARSLATPGTGELADQLADEVMAQVLGGGCAPTTTSASRRQA
jgi:lantibiotic modifying enzyme